MTSPLAKSNVVVTCWNAVEHTKVTIESLFATTADPFVLTILNNGSSDGTRDYLEMVRPAGGCTKLIVEHNTSNLGIIWANNRGQDITVSLGLPYTCICNNDLYFSTGWLAKLEEYLERNPKVGIVGPLRPAVEVMHHLRPTSTKRVVDETPPELSIDEELRHFQGPVTFDEAAEAICRKNSGLRSGLRCPPCAVITCCALLRNETRHVAGAVCDTRYDLYGSEDIDFSWRLSEAGYSCDLAKNIYVHHFRHRSIDASNLDRETYLRKNNLVFYERWRPTIFGFLASEEASGVDVDAALKDANNTDYFLLRCLAKNVDFMVDYRNAHRKSGDRKTDRESLS